MSKTELLLLIILIFNIIVTIKDLTIYLFDKKLIGLMKKDWKLSIELNELRKENEIEGAKKNEDIYKNIIEKLRYEKRYLEEKIEKLKTKRDE